MSSLISARYSPVSVVKGFKVDHDSGAGPCRAADISWPSSVLGREGSTGLFNRYFINITPAGVSGWLRQKSTRLLILRSWVQAPCRM